MFPRSYSCSSPLGVSAIHRLKRQQHLQKSPPKTFFVSSRLNMLPLSTLNSVKERGSNGALRSHLFAKRRTRRGRSRRFPIYAHVGSGVRFGAIRGFKKSWPVRRAFGRGLIASLSG